MNKKASLLDALPILLGFFTFAVAMLFIIYVLTAISPMFNSAETPAFAKGIFNKGNDAIPGIFDNLGAVMLIGIPLITAGMAYMLNANAIFFWLLTAFSSLFVMLGGVISFLWDKIAGVGMPLAGAAAKIPLTNWTMENYAIYAVLVVILILGAIFMRMRSQEGGAYNGI